MLDANNGYNLNLAKHVRAETAGCGIFWLEEPFHEDDMLYRDLRAWLHQQRLAVLIADGAGQADPRLVQWARRAARRDPVRHLWLRIHPLAGAWARVGRVGVPTGDCERWLQPLPMTIGCCIWLQKALHGDLLRHAQHVERRETSRGRALNITAQLDEVAIEGALSGDLRLIFQVSAHDPLTAAMLWPAEIKGMVNALFAQNRGYLQQF